jgi:hypothetical protein
MGVSRLHRGGKEALASSSQINVGMQVSADKIKKKCELPEMKVGLCVDQD